MDDLALWLYGYNFAMTLLGHNGAGKSTLIGYLLGFFTDERQHPFLPHFKDLIKPLDLNEVGFAPEASYLEESANLKEYFELMSKLKGVENSQMNEILEMVSLKADHKKPIKSYSKGMKQRLLLGLALIGNPKTLILDEPTSGLDPFGRDAIENLILDLIRSRKIIISTHSLEFAYKLNQEVWILQHGEVKIRKKFDSYEELKEAFFQYKPNVLL